MKTIYSNEQEINATIEKVENNLDNMNLAYNLIKTNKVCTIELMQSINRTYINEEYKAKMLSIMDEYGYNENTIAFGSEMWDMCRRSANKKVEYLFDAIDLIGDDKLIKYYEIADNKVTLKKNYKTLINQDYTVTLIDKDLEKKHTKLESIASILKEYEIYPFQLEYYINPDFTVNHNQFIN